MLNIEIKPDDIDAIVKTAVLNSMIGKTITDQVNKTLSGYNSPVEEGVKRVVAAVVFDVISQKYEAQIREAVTEKLAEKLTKEYIATAATAAADKIARAANERY